MGDPMLRVLLWLWAVLSATHVLLSSVVTGEVPDQNLWWAIGLSAALGLTRPSRQER